jgi:hypothetical protein
MTTRIGLSVLIATLLTAVHSGSITDRPGAAWGRFVDPANGLA